MEKWDEEGDTLLRNETNSMIPSAVAVAVAVTVAAPTSSPVPGFTKSVQDRQMKIQVQMKEKKNKDDSQKFKGTAMKATATPTSSVTSRKVQIPSFKRAVGSVIASNKQSKLKGKPRSEAIGIFTESSSGPGISGTVSSKRNPIQVQWGATGTRL